MCTVTIIVNKAATGIFLYKKTVLNVLNLHKLICKQLIKFFKYALIRKKNDLSVTTIISLVKNRTKYKLLYRKVKNSQMFIIIKIIHQTKILSFSKESIVQYVFI